MASEPTERRTLTTKVPDSVHDAIATLSARAGLTVSRFIRNLCERELKLVDAGYPIPKDSSIDTLAIGYARAERSSVSALEVDAVESPLVVSEYVGGDLRHG